VRWAEVGKDANVAVELVERERKFEVDDGFRVPKVAGWPGRAASNGVRVRWTASISTR
jgi:hypothetical protein